MLGYTGNGLKPRLRLDTFAGACHKSFETLEDAEEFLTSCGIYFDSTNI
jgi:viroplasmin and RNaseH domain-containing protein